MGIFILLMVIAPLAFGAVDRFVQIGLLFLLGVGIFLTPPAIARPSRIGNWLIVAGVSVLVLKEFGPSPLFGTTMWRKALTESYGVAFPWTHNPEPSRAFDGLLMGIVAGIWFLWVRTLAVDRSNRTVMLWVMLSSAAIVSIVSFATRGIDPDAIYGLRYTPGWVGFGPFPNRNHTACFLAMGTILGAGCVGWGGARKNYAAVAFSIILSIIAFVGLLATESRGGLAVFAVGFFLFIVLVLIRFPSIRSFSIAAGAVIMIFSIGMGFGAQVIARFSSKEGGEVSNALRVHIWQDTLRVWLDAPIFGHGIGTFTQIFPMYQEVATGGALVLHPESSWLQWLVELGALPVLVASVAAMAYIMPRLRVAYSTHRSIFMRAGPFSASAILLIHSIFDVPAHRWATAGFGLAALAIACAPTALPSAATVPNLVPAQRRTVLVPALIACFWLLPILFDFPAWSPLELNRLLTREQTTPYVSVRELERSLGYFPLNPTLHYSIALHQIDDPKGRRSAEWQQHFRIAARLVPGSWELAAMQARACTRVAPGLSLHYWQLAVERAGHRSEEVFGIAMRETVRVPNYTVTWEQYARLHPELLLTFARNVPEAKSREAYANWWTQRASTVSDLGDAEVTAFYALVEQRGTHEQFEQFCELHQYLRARDFQTWVRLLHKWGADEAAWKTLAAEWPEPAMHSTPSRFEPARLASLWENDPNDPVIAREYAECLVKTGDIGRANQIILTVAGRPNAPDWFVRKAAYVHAASGKARQAISLYLREKETKNDSF